MAALTIPGSVSATRGFFSCPSRRSQRFWVGDPEPGRRLLPALRALGQPSAERVLELSYLELQRMSDSVQKHDRGEDRLRPGQRVPPQPQHQARVALGVRGNYEREITSESPAS
jgi:hypothetical protein